MKNLRGSRYKRGQKEASLPKIDRITDFTGSSLKEFELVASQWDYRYVSDREIEEEYNRLREQLLRLNEKAGKKVLALQSKSYRVTHHSSSIDNKMQVFQEEIKNNNLIIGRLGLELTGLLARLEHLKATSKQTLDQQIKQTQKELQTLRIKNKSISRNNHKGIDTLDFSEMMLDQLKNIQDERIQINRKQKKLENRSIEVSSNNQKIIDSLQEIQLEFEQATQTIKELDRSRRVWDEQIVLQETFKQKQRKIKALIQNKHSLNRVKHIAFSQLMNKVKETEGKITAYDTAILEIEQQKKQTEKQWKLHKEELQKIQKQSKCLSLQKEHIQIEEQLPKKQERYTQQKGTSATIHIVQRRKEKYGKQEVRMSRIQEQSRRIKEPKQLLKPQQKIFFPSVKKTIEAEKTKRNDMIRDDTEDIKPNYKSLALQTLSITENRQNKRNIIESLQQLVVLNNQTQKQNKSYSQKKTVSRQNKLQKDQDRCQNKRQIGQNQNRIPTIDFKQKQEETIQALEIQQEFPSDGKGIILQNIVVENGIKVGSKQKFSVDLQDLQKGQKQIRIFKENERTTNEGGKEVSEVSEEVSEEVINEDQLISQSV